MAQGKARVLTLPEFKKAVKAAELTQHSKRNKAILYLQFGLGLRACEVRRLRVCDVLAPDGTIFEEVNLLNTMTKGKKQRHVYITNPRVIMALQEHICDYKADCEKRRIPFYPDMPLFRSQKGGFFNNLAFIKITTHIYNMVGLTGARSHSGRRTFATALLDSGADIKAVADILGHSSIQTTAGYHHSNPSRLKKISKKSIF
jgi:integrase/recombinase XerD